MLNALDFEGIEFPVSKRDYSKIQQKNNIYINVFCYENNFTYPDHIRSKLLQSYAFIADIR